MTPRKIGDGKPRGRQSFASFLGFRDGEIVHILNGRPVGPPENTPPLDNQYKDVERLARRELRKLVAGVTHGDDTTTVSRLFTASREAYTWIGTGCITDADVTRAFFQQAKSFVAEPTLHRLLSIARKEALRERPEFPLAYLGPQPEFAKVTGTEFKSWEELEAAVEPEPETPEIKFGQQTGTLFDVDDPGLGGLF